MNFYFCETCGKRITDVDIQQGEGRNKKLKGVYCKDCAAGVQTMDLPALSDDDAREHLAQVEAAKPKSAPLPTASRSGSRVATSRVGSARREQLEAPPVKSNNNQIIAGGAVAAVVVVGLLTWMLTRSAPVQRPRASEPTAVAIAHTNAPPPSAIPEEKHVVEATPVKAEAPTLTQVQQPAAAPASAFTSNIGEDFRESIASKKLSDIVELEKSGKASATKIYGQYYELANSSYRSTKAGQEAVAKLKTLPTPPPEPGPETKTSAAGSGVWWEGEDAVENDFVDHCWLSGQGLDFSKISGGKYLNHLNDATWLKSKGKSVVKSLFARYVVEVPADGTYTLWVREYDPWGAGPWKFRWDDGKWFDVPPNQGYVDKVEIGKDRWLVWRSYPNQVLAKGKHTFRLEVNMETHGVSGYDCFLLTTEPFKPDGPKKP